MKANFVYPPMPSPADENVLKPSPSFQKSVFKVTMAMLLFIVVYLLTLAAAVAIAAAGGAAGIALVVVYASFYTVVLGGGLLLAGVMLLYFLVKFMFKRSKTDYSGMVEITEQEQPELFAFIRQLTTEAHAPFPKRIFLSPEVNAFVFYDSTFWSMFLPVKKNLNIGLGLVNTLNLSEFKAVMAHEFGHFSQRSMKFGSYIYHVNRIIYNMLYDNDGYQKALSAIASLHAFVRLCMMGNVYLIQGVQSILRGVYVVVNKNYLSLSRQMEFHADAVSAYVAGANQSASALVRLDVGQMGYDNLFGHLNQMAGNKQRTQNLYPAHTAALRVFAAQNQLTTDEAGVPVIDKKLPVLNNTQIQVNNQWSSHPSTNDREAALKQLALSTESVTSSAWVLFKNADEVQARLTDLVYRSIEEKYEPVNAAETVAGYLDQARKNSFDNCYKGFYSSRSITNFEVDELIAQNNPATPAASTAIINVKELTFDTLFSDEHCNLPRLISSMEGDIATAEAIPQAKHIKTFDFRGLKHKSSYAGHVKDLLEKELQTARTQLEELDKQAFLFCYLRAKNPQVIADGYKELIDCQRRLVDEMQLNSQMVEKINPMFGTMQYTDIELNMADLSKLEKTYKPHLEALLQQEHYQAEDYSTQREAITAYLAKDLIYFTRPAYNDAAIKTLTTAVNAHSYLVNHQYFQLKRDLLNTQLLQLNIPLSDEVYAN